MSGSIEIHCNWSALDRLKRNLAESSGLWRKACIRALHRIGKGAQTLTGRAIREAYTVKAATVNERLRIDKSSINNLEISIRPAKKGRHPLSLSFFKGRPKSVPAKPPRKGVFAQVRKDSGGGYFPSAFVAEMASGNVGVFQRKSSKRTPIEKLFGPSVAGMMSDTGTRHKIVPEVERRLSERLLHEVDWVLKKAKLI